MKYKVWSVVFLLLMMIGLFFSAWLFFKLQQSNEALEETQKALIEKDKRISSITDSLSMLLTQAEEKYADKEGERTEDPIFSQKKRLQDQLANAEYFVGLYMLGENKKAFTKAASYLRDHGYNIITEQELDSRPSWLAQSSTVFYYTKESKKVAEGLAEAMQSETGKSYAISQGAGRGVPASLKDKYFYVHIVE